MVAAQAHPPKFHLTAVEVEILVKEGGAAAFGVALRVPLGGRAQLAAVQMRQLAASGLAQKEGGFTSQVQHWDKEQELMKIQRAERKI